MKHFYYVTGLGFLALAKAKHSLRGYATPKPFDLTETDRCIDYDLAVVDRWLELLPVPIEGKRVLELGPGSDLGIGLYLLAKGAAAYSACDVHDLMKNTPPSFYERLFERLATPHLREELQKLKEGRSTRLNYVVRTDFDLVAAVGERTIDVVLSQAAFEHFDDVDETIRRLTAVCKPGAKIVAEIDLMTHSRWIREKDPLNIYRYPEWLYRLFYFRGQPNRVRPREYKHALEKNGWKDVSIVPAQRLDQAPAGLNKRFIDAETPYLSMIVQATLSETIS